MIVSGISDQHGHLSSNSPDVDVLCIVGDFVPLLSSAENWKSWQEHDWIERKYMKWLGNQSAENILIVPGNHDICMYDPSTRDETRTLLESDERVTVLDMVARDSIEIQGVLFSGHPFTPTIQDRNWAFSQRRSSPAVKLATDAISDQTTVLLTHGPPQGLLDTEDRYGCAALAHRILEVGPRLTLCGHIHEERGKRAKYWDLHGRVRTIANVSICDEHYNPKGAKVASFEVFA